MSVCDFVMLALKFGLGLRTAGEAELRQVLEPYGEVMDLAIMKDTQTGESKGLASACARSSAEFGPYPVAGRHVKDPVNLLCCTYICTLLFECLLRVLWTYDASCGTQCMMNVCMI